MFVSFGAVNAALLLYVRLCLEFLVMAKLAFLFVIYRQRELKFEIVQEG